MITLQGIPLFYPFIRILFFRNCFP
jgi:hypothetical protein